MNIQRVWDNQTAGSKPIRKQWLRQTSTANLLDLLELGSIIRNDRSMEGSTRTEAPSYMSESIVRIRTELFKRTEARERAEGRS